MTQCFQHSLIFCAIVTLAGCSGRLTEQLAVEAREEETVQHPLSYLPIQQASHSENAEVVDVGFSQRYDVYCVLIPDSSTVYRNCQILGTTGRDESKSTELHSLAWKGHWDVDLFEKMLVLETEDGRLAYIPPGSVRYIEEVLASPQPQAPKTFPLSGL